MALPSSTHGFQGHPEVLSSLVDRKDHGGPYMGGSYGLDKNPCPYLIGRKVGNSSPDGPRKKRDPGENREGDLLFISGMNQNVHKQWTR